MIWQERRIIGAVILRTMKDAQSQNIKRSLEAREWLTETGVRRIAYLKVPRGPRHLHTWVDDLPPLNVN